MRMRLNRVLALAGMTGAVAMAASSACAQTGADFYKGKTVTYIAATSPGGGYDLYGRLVAEFMQKHLPGSTFVVKNVPGAGHIVGANTIYASKPDGLTIGIFNTGLIYNQVLEPPASNSTSPRCHGSARRPPTRASSPSPPSRRSSRSRICRTARRR